jgi:predicted alpha-1,2-mannosidase
LKTHGEGFIEGNSWNYSFYIPHDVPGMIQLMGGDERFVQHLDSLFTMHLDDIHFAETEDVTRVGLIGNYVHGNEPSHHVPYLYDWTSQPWKSQERVRQICEAMYRDAADGLCGNDDCGQMSAWYIFSALGFYPVCPGTTQYAIGCPLTDQATLSFQNGNMLYINVIRQQIQDVYIQSVTLNGVLVTKPFLDHANLVGGGKLVFVMGPRPHFSYFRKNLQNEFH